jgi:hypothetical protein
VRDHKVGIGSPYIECGICAMTIRLMDAVEQRGILVCSMCVDDDPDPGPVTVTDSPWPKTAG